MFYINSLHSNDQLTTGHYFTGTDITVTNAAVADITTTLAAAATTNTGVLLTGVICLKQT